MRSETRVDSVVFHLTPTRTRCDLVIIANGKMEKIASGLLEPFLSHLKTARDQIAKGGYSIHLELEPRSDDVWFTKGTVERFVRFVSTPEVLERVCTIESEILQIEEAISIQGNENLDLSTVDNQLTRHPKCIEGSKSISDAVTDKAMVLYKPGSHPDPPDSNGSTKVEENSKVQFLRVLETRKCVLQKEQGMAFARAQAAGYDMDNMPHLISFAERFGASRLREACCQFIELWKGKHETGQWLEVEATEALSSQSEFYSLNASGIILTGDTRKQSSEVWPVPDLSMERNGSGDTNAELSSHPSNPDDTKDKRQSSDAQVPIGPPREHFQGQFQHTPFPQWPMYPLQGMPYYQNYPGINPYFQSPYPPMEDPRFNDHPRMGLKRHSMDSKDSNIESEPLGMGYHGTRSQGGADRSMSEFEKGASQGRESRRKHGRSGKKQSGKVGMRSKNYTKSKRYEESESESCSDSESESEVETEDLHSDGAERKKKHSKPSKKKEDQAKHVDIAYTYSKDEVVNRQDADSGNWQAFQNFILRGEEKVSTVSGDIFAGEKEPTLKRRHNDIEADPILLPERDSNAVQEPRIMEFDSVNGKGIIVKQVASNDEFLALSEGRGLLDSQLNSQFKEIEAGRGGYQRATSDDFMIYGRENGTGNNGTSDPLAEHEYEHAGNLDKSSLYDVTDESFIVPFRSGSNDQLGIDRRAAIDMDSEFPSAPVRIEDSACRVKSQLIYEPDDLTMLPDRGFENESVGYDPAKDFDLHTHVGDSAILESRNQEDVTTCTKEVAQKSDKEKKLKLPHDRSEKRKDVIMRRERSSSKSNPLADAQKRAEKLRAFKADLQKVKKEQEEEAIKRLEALKLERQKRIAARSGSNPQQNKAQLPLKVSPSSCKGSKFSDSEPTHSPLQKLSVRTSSVDSRYSQKITTNGSNNGLSRSVSSLPELKKEPNGLVSQTKAASVQTKRLSDPKGSTSGRASSLKPVTSGKVPKKNLADDPQVKVSAIMLLDKDKSAALPELRIKTSAAPSDALQSIGSKETLQNGDGMNPLARKGNENLSSFSNADDNPVIEKTVVMLEKEMVPSPVVRPPEEIIELKDGSYGVDRTVNTGVGSEYVTIRAPPSPVILGESGYGQLNLSEVIIDYSNDEPRNFSSSDTKSYQARYARVASLEEPATTKSVEYSEPPLVSNSELGILSAEMISKARVSGSLGLSSAEKDQDMDEKPRSKESKGFRKLLKFGRKSHHNSGTGEGNVDVSDCSSVEDNTMPASSGDVHSLKNLISQDETRGGTPPKVSRPFSLLSPFRNNKTAEKKQAV